MTEKRRDKGSLWPPADSSDDTWAEQNTSRGGKPSDCVDYEKAQSSGNDQKNYDEKNGLF